MFYIQGFSRVQFDSKLIWVCHFQHILNCYSRLQLNEVYPTNGSRTALINQYER